MNRLSSLVALSGRVKAERGRLKKAELVADYLRELAGEGAASSGVDVEIAVSFLMGELRQGRIGVGGALISEAARTNPGASELALQTVDRVFDEIEQCKGAGSKSNKLERLSALFAEVSEDEQAFLSDLLRGDLRQGALEGVLVEAVSMAAAMGGDAIRRATMLGGSLRAVAIAALVDGDLSAFDLEPLRPVQPMLAQSAASPSEALGRINPAVFEWKLDGVRIQAHRVGDEIRLFSRAGNDITSAAPEIVEALASLPEESFVLDGEAIALDESGRPLPFQTTMRRFGRRRGVEPLRRELPLSAFFFDLLHLGGEDWYEKPLSERLARLRSLVPGSMLVHHLETADPEAAEAFFGEAIDRGQEGLVAKDPASTYEAGRRGAGWIKIKPAQTLDLVVLAAEWGSGRRAGWLSNLHLGAKASSGGFEIVGKTFKGMTDTLLAWQTDKLQTLATSKSASAVQVKPELVVEVAIDGVQRSPRYASGVALRFARLRRYRSDKRPSEVDTVETIRKIGGLDRP